MKEHHREKNGKNETRARALAAHDRNYWVGLLETVDTWFPVYRVRHPDVDRAEIVVSAAAPAARCRQFLRWGRFMSVPPVDTDG
jgi:hypothetical protein